MAESRKPSGDPSELRDMPTGAFRDAAHRVADLAADYREDVERYDVLPRIAPGITSLERRDLRRRGQDSWYNSPIA
jgi:hypothetical protein